MSSKEQNEYRGVVGKLLQLIQWAWQKFIIMSGSCQDL